MGSEYSFRLTRKAVSDLDAILDYTVHSLSNPAAAKAFYDALLETLTQTAAFPESGAPVSNPSVAVQVYESCRYEATRYIISRKRKPEPSRF